MPSLHTNTSGNRSLANGAIGQAMRSMPYETQDADTTEQFNNNMQFGEDDQSDPASPQQVETTVSRTISGIAPAIVGEIAQEILDELTESTDEDIEDEALSGAAMMASYIRALSGQGTQVDPEEYRRGQRILSGLAEGIGDQPEIQPVATPTPEQADASAQKDALTDQAVEEAAEEMAQEGAGAPQEGGKGGPAQGLPGDKKDFSPHEMAESPDEQLAEQLEDEEDTEAVGDQAKAQQAGQLHRDKQQARKQQAPGNVANQLQGIMQEAGMGDDPEIQQHLAELAGSKSASRTSHRKGQEKKESKKSGKAMKEKLKAAAAGAKFNGYQPLLAIVAAADIANWFGADEATFGLMNLAVILIKLAFYIREGPQFQRNFIKRNLARFIITMFIGWIPGLNMAPEHVIDVMIVKVTSDEDSAKKQKGLEETDAALSKQRLN